MTQVSPFIVCVGSGTRLCPLTTAGSPKQFLLPQHQQRDAAGMLANLRAQLAKQEKDEPAAAAGQGDYVAKFREYKYQETLFELFAKQFEMAKIDEAREGATIQVLDTAEPPELKSKPKKALIAIIATLATGFALLLFVFIRQALRNAGHNPESAQKLQALKASWRRALGRA